MNNDLITIANIGLHYKDMGEEEKNEHFDILSTLFHKRGRIVDQELAYEGKLNKNWELQRSQIVGQKIFSIKDMLEPIGEYIEKIKESAEYKIYITDIEPKLLKLYSLQCNVVGKVKYLINFHNGIKTHEDGSRFFDIKTFSNKAEMEIFEKDLLVNGYVYR